MDRKFRKLVPKGKLRKRCVYQKPHGYSRNMVNVPMCPVLAGSTLLLTQDHVRYPLFDFYP